MNGEATSNAKGFGLDGGLQGNGDGYHGKLGIYIADGACRSVVDVRADGVYQLEINCSTLPVPQRISDDRIYFAEGPSILLIDDTLYHFVEGKSARLADAHYAYYFCTNRHRANPKIGVEVRLVQPRVGSYLHAQIFIADEGAQPRIQVQRAINTISVSSDGGFLQNSKALRFELDPKTKSFTYRTADAAYSETVQCWQGK